MTWDSIYDTVRRLVDGSANVETVMGSEFIGLPPDLPLVKTAQLEHDHQRYKLSYTLPGAQAEFSWLVEISITNADQQLRHYLLRAKPQVVETYGRTELPVDPAGAEALATELAEL